MHYLRIAAEYSDSSEFSSIVKGITSENGAISIEGLPASGFSLVAASLFLKTKAPILLAVKNNVRMNEIAADLAAFLPEDAVSCFPTLDILPYEFISPIDKIERERIRSLFRMIAGERNIIIAPVEALLRRIPSPRTLQNRSIVFKAGDEYQFDSISATLTEYGYTRESRVESYGQFSIKGGIIDIFPSSANEPIRLDFFGDTLESIRSFDPETQSSRDSLDEALVLPRKELLLTLAEKEKIAKMLKAEYVKGKKLPDDMLHALESGDIPAAFPGAEDYFTLAMESATLFEYLPKDTIVLAAEKSELLAHADSIEHTYQTIYAQKSKSQFALDVHELIENDAFSRHMASAVNMQTLTSHAGAVHLSIKGMNSFYGKLAAAREEFRQKLDGGWKISIATVFEGQARRMIDLFREFSPCEDTENPDYNADLGITISPLSGGLLIGELKRAIYTDHDIFGKSYRQKRSFKSKRSRAIDSFAELSPGDFVVHINHGIGIFKNIERMEASGVERDYIVIEYAGGDTLFVALDQLNMVQKYTALDEGQIRVDALGKKSAWNRIKQRVQETVDEIAEELIGVYAKRKANKGFPFPADTVWQEEFEARFEYEETQDQISAIEDVKDDMEKQWPMDRLICGDVGFGKTEVAIRAAFKAAMAGKQTAILVPTTILAMQHYNNFKKRFEGYPINVEMISRFRQVSDIRKTKAKLSNGEVDIVIGTHALLAEDVFIKNLGLLIIDEEQRFGVKHKEKLKKLRSQVDVLTLSATPIPRTLHMSLAGIRNLSVIETPPENRQAVETFVLEDNPDIIKMALERELERNGQVFFIHNRVQDIDVQVEFLKSLVPEARVTHAHGQLSEDELENIMIDFLEYRYDILVSTTIIESGVDMPRVNTIIVNRADTFGLSQLYQLKGRVGRSDKQAYAYFFYPRHIVLSETSMKRLNVISEFTELGSGFKIAMKDMEIRGAGNLLGREQSGCIMDVGFDLYCSMLEEAVRKLKGEKPLRTFRTPVFISVNTFIPDSYISDVKQKIEFYKRFESCDTIEEIETIAAEMKDRFGEISTEVKPLLELQKVRAMASALLIEDIMETERTIRIKVSGETQFDIPKVLTVIKDDKRFKFDPHDPTVLVFTPGTEDPEKKLEELKKWLQQIS